MPARWVICPVVLDRGARKPKVSIIFDPGIAPYFTKDEDGNSIMVRKTYHHSSCIDEADWCLSFVRGVDLSALDTDPEVINVLGHDHEDEDRLLAKTPRGLEWTPQKLKALKSLLENKNVDISDLNEDAPLWKAIAKLGQKIRPGFKPKGTWVK